MKRHDEETRRERIQYAEKLLQRLKAGPKQLESAYKLSTILAEQEQQRRERTEQKQLEWQKNAIEGQNLIEQATEWIENQKEHIRNYRKRCAEYKNLLQNDIKERENQKLMANQQLNQMEEKELKTNMKQMQVVLDKEHKITTDRRMDRQKADYLSKHNMQQRRQRNANQIFQSIYLLNLTLSNNFYSFI